MTQDNLLSISDIARELDTGKATISFLLKRFENQIPSQAVEGIPHYPAQVIHTLLNIQEKLKAGKLPASIEETLTSAVDYTASADEGAGLNGFDITSGKGEDIRMSKDGLILLKSLIQDIGEQQKRIASAHEKRAIAEERKAVAIEKRALAEEKKAEAMNNIASALQEMNRLRADDDDRTAAQIAHQAAAAVAQEDFLGEDLLGEEALSLEPPEEISELEDVSNLEELSDLLEETDTDLEDLIEAGDLIEETALSPQTQRIPEVALDDLSLLIERELSETEGSETPDPEIPDSGDDGPAIPLDDLNLLIDPAPSDAALDDLSLLIDPDKDPDHAEIPDNEDLEGSADTGLDDLSLLIDGDTGDSSEPAAAAENSAGELDDLSKLIDPSRTEVAETKPSGPAPGMDDLSLLVDKKPEKTEAKPQVAAAEMDDLSLLIDQDAAADLSGQSEGTDPPSNDESPDFPEISLDLSPKDNLEKYKAAVMKVIIGLKQDGLDVEQTTACMNHNQIQTLSGKPEWGSKAIAQIYKFIDAAK